MFGQARVPALPAGLSLVKRSAVVTGSNSGLGLEIARQLLSLDLQTLIIAVRSVERGNVAANSLRQEYGGATILVKHLDLECATSIADFCQQIAQELNGPLDILVLNAGLNSSSFRLSAAGHESVVQINHYANAALLHYLRPLLQRSTLPGRVTAVNSAMHLSVRERNLPWAKDAADLDVGMAKFYDDPNNFGLQRYAESKFLNALHMQIAASTEDNIIINYACPGLIERTGFDESLSWWLRRIMIVVRKLYGRPLADAGRSIIHAACVVAKDSNGKFLQHGQIQDVSKSSTTFLAKKVYDETSDALGFTGTD